MSEDEKNNWISRLLHCIVRGNMLVAYCMVDKNISFRDTHETNSRALGYRMTSS